MFGDKIQVENRSCPCKLGVRVKERKKRERRWNFRGRHMESEEDQRRSGEAGGEHRESVMRNSCGK